MNKFNKGFSQILILLLLAGGIIIGVYLVNQKTQLFSKATESNLFTTISPKYFRFTVPNNPRESFIVKITSPAVIKQAKNDLDGSRSLIVGGKVKSGNDEYNNNGFRNLSWHLDPSTIVLGEVSIPECSALPSAIEKNLSNFLNKQFCPFTAKIKAMYNYPPVLTSPSPSPSSSGEACIQVITRACSPIYPRTCRDFPTPCDVPEGWIVQTR